MSDETDNRVTLRSEWVTFPTYGTGKPDKNPMFLEKRVYQGSSGAVYPYPVIDKIFDEKRDRAYQAVVLENRWIKAMVLPELGGRVQMALDKTNGYHFVYYNRVIKPALVGLCGPWISGGIEFNWPQHHRPGTFGPVLWRMVENDDGSKTLWCSEIDRMNHTQGTHGLTLHPDKAFLEVRVQLYNRTPVPQTFLWWANPAVHVHEDTQSVFPQDVHAVMDHGKRDVSRFPVATGVYYKVNYAPGTDISRYRSIPVPTSYMAYHSEYDFLSCYDHRHQAGMVHVANHHISPGKKQWTWGHGDFGRAWDRQLTDEDGPYVELMCGCYTDNQPDFSWLMPYEEKSFVQCFMPYQRIGPVKNASREACINLEVSDGRAFIGVYVTSVRKGLVVRLRRADQVLFSRTIDLAPQTPLSQEVRLGRPIAAHELTLEVHDQAGRRVIAFTPIGAKPNDVPPLAQAAPLPAAIPTAEQLYLTGLHLEQYRHATFDPQCYYEEALRRDPTDVRNNNALGLLLLGRGRFAESESCFRRAIATLTQRNANPYDGEAFYNLGLALTLQGRFDEAFGAFYKAVWNAVWQDAGYFELACIACRRREYGEGLELVDRSLQRNGVNHKARHLKAAALRHLGRLEEAWGQTEVAETLGKIDLGTVFERILIAGRQGLQDVQRQARETWGHYTQSDVHSRIEVALDYGHAGLWDEAIACLSSFDSGSPMEKYYLGWFALQKGDKAAAQSLFQAGATADPDYCFPNRLECIDVLGAAMAIHPGDAKAPYYLGNFLFARRDYVRAIALWERSRDHDGVFPTVWRNLGLAYFNKSQNPVQAHRALEKAFLLDPADARVFFELDQLYKRLNRDPARRLERMERHADLVGQRDDLTIERIALMNRLGRHEQALDLLVSHVFHPWEGGEGKTTGQYVFALVQIARRHIEQGRFDHAIECLTRAQTYPPNLGEGKLPGAAENRIHYYLGVAHGEAGRADEARALFEMASAGVDQPASAVYYYDQPPDTIYYQGLALRKLGRERDAEARFGRLVDYGRTHLEDSPTIDYFAVSLPDFLVFDEDLAGRNRIHCLYMMGLGLLGLGDIEVAQSHLEAVLQMDRTHLGAWSHCPGRATIAGG